MLARLLAAAVDAASASPIKPVDMVDAGRVLATLDDWRALMFAMLLIIAVLVIMIGSLVWLLGSMATKRSANDQATLAALTENSRVLEQLSGVIRQSLSERGGSERKT